MQVIAKKAEPVGQGELALAYEQLKIKLEIEKRKTMRESRELNINEAINYMDQEKNFMNRRITKLTVMN